MSAILPGHVRAELIRRAAAATSPQQLDDLATEYGLMPRELVDLLKQHQPPRPTQPTPVPQPPRTPMQAVDAPTRDHIATALHQAEQSSSARIRNKAKKVRTLLDDLTAALEADRERDAARKEVERLEAQLRAAKAKLTGKPAAKPTTTGDGPSSSEVRSWARSAGVDCPAVGRVPASVREAYDEAHREAVA